MYAKGQGVIKGYVEAYAWVSAAAAQGNDTATNYRDLVAEEMSNEQLEKAQELSKVYYEKYVK
jgi:TPR repeat protein